MAETAPLPEPLTLEFALAQVEAEHPEMELARARLATAEADLQAAEALTGSRLSLEGRLRWLEPSPIAPDQSTADHKVSLFLRKRLYDFGRSRGAEEAASATLEGEKLALLESVRRQRLAIMTRYFNVLRADQQYALLNESLATSYVALDRLRQRHELGQISDIELLQVESGYQKVLRQRLESEQMQRITRMRLATVLNRPDVLSADLMRPELPQLERELPSLEELEKEALVANLSLQKLRKALVAAEARLSRARSERWPELDGELEVSEYTRESGGSDRWRASLNLRLPLYNGGATSAAVAREQAGVNAARAALRSAEFSLKEALLEQWMGLSSLRLKHDEVDKLSEYHELYLERSRANYEMEVKADLGDAMVRLTEAQLAELEYRLDAALAWEQLDGLLGRALNREQTQLN